MTGRDGDADGGEDVLVALAALELLLQLDELANAVDHSLHELHLRLAYPRLVGDVPHAADGRRVLARRASRLQSERSAHGLERVRVRAKLLELDEHAGAKTRAEVRRARAQKTEVVVVHERVPVLLDAFLDSRDALDPASKHRHDVSTVLHADDTHVVLFVAPHEERLLVIVKDAAATRPVTSSASTREESAAARLLEQEMVLLKLVLLLGSHAVQRVVLALELVAECRQSRRQ